MGPCARWALLLVVSAVCVLFGDLAPARAGDRPARAPLIVISIDGFRADYLTRGLSPTLARLARTGVRAASMRPSFPPVTMPNHYTLMTGLRPDHHGIVDNSMIDPQMPGMSFGGPHGKGSDSDPRWWSQATPLWISAERQGLTVGASLWPGATVEMSGLTPQLLQRYRPGLTPHDQVTTILQWLDASAGRRPALVLAHFSDVDSAGHAFGPDSREVDQAIVRVDQAIAELVEGLRRCGLLERTNLVIVSDHGMAATSPKRTILLDDLIDLRHAAVPATGAYAGVDPLPGDEKQITQALVGRRGHMTCWRKGDIPPRLRYGRNPRVPGVFCLAEVGWLVTTREDVAAQSRPLLGEHGYEPTEPSMQAIFLAHGPAFRRGLVLPAFDNVDVYPMLARLLGVTPRANDGRLTDIGAALY